MTDIQTFDVHGHSQNCSNALRERFVLDEKRDVIDKLNSIGRKGYCHEGSPEDQFHLRERSSWCALASLSMP